MKYFKTLIVSASAAVLILFCSCGSDTVTNTGNNTPLDTSAFTYPFGIGNTWNYIRTYTASDIRPDSILHYFTINPIRNIGTITILYDTSINNITTRCFTEEYTEYGYDTITYNGRFYFIQTDSSLIEFAYRNFLYPSFIPSKKQNIIYKSEKNLCVSQESSDSLNILDPPVIVLKYPIRTGTQWNYNFSGGGNITKKYEQFVNVNLSSGSVTCMKVSTTYSFLDGAPIYNYYSKYGIMERYWFINDEHVSTPQNPEGIGTVDYTEEFKVSSFQINP